MPSIASPLAGQRFEWTIFWSSGTFSIGASILARKRKWCKGDYAVYGREILPQWMDCARLQRGLYSEHK
jgi:hypothetical protein